MSKNIVCRFFEKAFWLVAFLLPVEVAQAQPAMKEEAGLRWVCGGVGSDERRALGALESQSNLKLQFVTVKRGGYLADVDVSIIAKGGKTPLLKVVAGGPICLIHAPAGNYLVETSYKGVRRTARTTIAAAMRSPIQIVFSFPGEPWDGVWASDEEKRQAREP